MWQLKVQRGGEGGGSHRSAGRNWGFSPQIALVLGLESEGVAEGAAPLVRVEGGYFSFPFLTCGVWEKAVRRRDGAGRGKSELGEGRV